jgi:hypothetical protein
MHNILHDIDKNIGNSEIKCLNIRPFHSFVNPLIKGQRDLCQHLKLIFLNIRKHHAFWTSSLDFRLQNHINICRSNCVVEQLKKNSKKTRVPEVVCFMCHLMVAEHQVSFKNSRFYDGAEKLNRKPVFPRSWASCLSM